MHPVQIKLWVLALQDELSAPDQREAEILNLVIIFVLVLLDAGQNRTGDEYFFSDSILAWTYAKNLSIKAPLNTHG
jgi:hypothetical protein